MGINSNMDIFYANKNIKTSPNWTQIPGKLTNISYSNGQVYGVNKNGNIFLVISTPHPKFSVHNNANK